MNDFPNSEISLPSEGKLIEILPAKPAWEEKIDLVRDLYGRDSTDAEFDLFCYTAKRLRLDPLARQIYLIKRGGVMTIQVGIDGFRARADQTGKYAGSERPVHCYLKDVEDRSVPFKTFVRVWKIVDGLKCAFEADAYWDEYCPKADREAFFWRKMPHGQLAKCAEALALRKAFPAELSGVYVTEEMDQAGSNRENAEDDNCVDCKQPISDWINPLNRRQRYTVKQIVELSRQLYGKRVCGECINKRNQAKHSEAQEKLDSDRAKRDAKKLPTPEAEIASQWETLMTAKPDAIGRKYNVAR